MAAFTSIVGEKHALTGHAAVAPLLAGWAGACLAAAEVEVTSKQGEIGDFCGVPVGIGCARLKMLKERKESSRLQTLQSAKQTHYQNRLFEPSALFQEEN